MFNYTSGCETKVITDFFSKSDPRGCQKVRKEDRRSPRGIQKEPQRASKTEDATNKIQRWSPKKPRNPRGAPEAQEAIFGCSKAFFGSPQGTPLAKQWRRANSVI